MWTSKPLSLDDHIVGGNGLLHRRLFLARGAAALGVGALRHISGNGEITNVYA
jgi:hypothetical protein